MMGEGERGNPEHTHLQHKHLQHKLAIVYHPDFAVHGYTALRERVAPAFDELRIRGLLSHDGVEVLEAEPADEKLAARVHSEAHIRGVINSGYYEIALLSAGAVIQGAVETVTDNAACSFSFVGAAGHHASHDGFWGFCYLNDVAMAIEYLRSNLQINRFAIVDIDPHFGDGTRDILGPDEDILHINFHSGYAMEGKNGSNNMDIALPHQADDFRFLAGVEEALEEVKGFPHELLFIIFGHDSHRDDYGAFELSDGVYEVFAAKVKELSPRRVCYVLSGGANPRVARKAIGDVVEVLAH
jgi:acetoin utilization deacetylase AcuC-like enzyme